jgi:cobalt-zinc-cadmium efflux system protein
MYWTGWRWLDPAISFVIIAVIAWSSWGLLRESASLSIDAVPTSVEPEKIRSAALRIEGIRGIHHIHVWAMSTTENALTAHLVLHDGLSAAQVHQIKKRFRHDLEHLNIGHATLETECESDDCGCKSCDSMQAP